MDPELKAYLEGMFQNLTQQIAETRQENQKTRQDLTQQIAETRVLIEDVRHDVQGVADGVLTVNQKLDRYIAETDLRITRLERRAP
ncbi:MAG: hypothetical protein M1499_07900 [Firmicutes bacterium]|nr:hypothetical protein [Bacillota bacterium]